MSFTVVWGYTSPDQSTQAHRHVVSTSKELDDALNQALDTVNLDPNRQPLTVTMYPTDRPDGAPGPALQLGVGHPERSFLTYYGTIGVDEQLSAWGTDPGLDPLDEETVFVQSGEPSFYPGDQTRLTPTQARQAAHEYLRTGRRPTIVDWFID